MDTFNNIIIYIFGPMPGPTFNYYYFVLGLVIVLLILSIGIIFYIKKNKDNKAFKKLFRGYPSKILLLTTVLAIYLPARYYRVPFFSMRALLYIVIAVIIYLLVKIVLTFIKEYPVEKKKRDERTEKNKYLLKKKKK